MPNYDHYLIHNFGRCVFILLMTSTYWAAQHSSTVKYVCFMCVAINDPACLCYSRLFHRKTFSLIKFCAKFRIVFSTAHSIRSKNSLFRWVRNLYWIPCVVRTPIVRKNTHFFSLIEITMAKWRGWKRKKISCQQANGWNIKQFEWRNMIHAAISTATPIIRVELNQKLSPLLPPYSSHSRCACLHIQFRDEQQNNKREKN